MITNKHKTEEFAFINYPSSKDTIHATSTNGFLINRFYYFSININDGLDLFHYMVDPSNGDIYEVEQYWRID